MSPSSRERLPRFTLRNAADINHLFVHLLTHGAPPRVDFRVDGLHAIHSQRAQDRFARLADSCNCLIGETLAATAMLLGMWVVWASSGGWLEAGMAVIAAVLAGLAGKIFELAWTRIRLLRVLQDLRRRLGTADDSPERDFVQAPTDPHADIPRLRLAQRSHAPLTRHADHARRPRVVIRDLADIDRLLIHLATHWALPRIDIHVDSIPGLEVQRAQSAVSRYSGGCSYLPAAFLSAAIFLGGLLYIVWTQSQAWFRSARADWWLLKLDWDDAVPVVAAAVGAALVGTALEWGWKRVRLLLVLRGLRGQLG